MAPNCLNPNPPNSATYLLLHGLMSWMIPGSKMADCLSNSVNVKKLQHFGQHISSHLLRPITCHLIPGSIWFAPSNRPISDVHLHTVTLTATPGIFNTLVANEFHSGLPCNPDFIAYSFELTKRDHSFGNQIIYLLSWCLSSMFLFSLLVLF